MGSEGAKTKTVKFRHGMLALGSLAAVMFACMVGLGSEPQVPMVIGCALAGGIAMYLGFSWEDVLDGMVRGITESLEAVLILMAIGMLVGVWIESGTVPTMICYGLQVVTPELFLPLSFLVTAAVGVVLGAWGAAGTIGIAFLGIAAALDVPLGMAAGTVVAGAYVSEIVSPLVDGPNLTAAISECGVFSLCKRFLVVVLVVCAGCAAVYLAMGLGLGAAGEASAGSGSGQVDALLMSLEATYDIGPLTLIPLLAMIVCIALKVPAIPSFLVAIAIGMVEAVALQGVDLATMVEVANTGVTSATGIEDLDRLLSNGGIQSMMETISIIVLVMAYGGVLQRTGLMDSLVEPIVSKLRRFGQLVAATVLSGALYNVLLPRPVSRHHAVCSDVSQGVPPPRRAQRRVGEHRELERGHHVGSGAVEHVRGVHGDGVGRGVPGIRAVCVFLLCVPAGGAGAGGAVREAARLGGRRGLR